MKSTAGLLFLCITFAASCSDPVDPSVALNAAHEIAESGDWPAAYEAYGQAMGNFTEADPGLELAVRGRIKSLCAIRPQEALELAKVHLEEFIAEHGEADGPDLVGGMAGDFREVGNLDAASLVTGLGLRQFPGDPGLRNLATRLNKMTWQAMEQDLSSIGYLRQAGAEAVRDLGFVDEAGSEILGQGESLLQLIDPLTYKLILEQGYQGD